MIYEARVNVPANTTRAAPVEQDVIVTPGVVRQLEVQFPQGCGGLVHVQILHWERVLWPSGPDEDFAADGTHLVFPEEFRIQGWPFAFTVRAWNEDDTYAHTPIVRFSVVAEQVGLVERLTALIGGPPRRQVRGG